MTYTSRLAWDAQFCDYNFGTNHPMQPTRLDLTARLMREFDLLPVNDPAPTRIASDSLLQQIHTNDYIEAVKTASDPTRTLDHDTAISHGLDTPDVPIVADMHNAAARIAQGTVDLALDIALGRITRGFNVAGGLHHAMPDRASGFCLYNDLALAAHALHETGLKRVAIVDLDAHHGDGTEAIFANNPEIFTASIHQWDGEFFPGTGQSTDVGGPGALGSSLNTPLPAGTTDSGWLRALHSTIMPALAAFKPDIVISQHGCDTHLDDPLSGLALSLDAQRLAATWLSDFTAQHCEGRWLATGGGGYEIIDVVPRSWTHVAAIVAGQPLDPQTAVDPNWLTYVRQLTGRPGPATMTDGADAAFTPWPTGINDCADDAINATRQAIQHYLSLDN